MKSAFKKKKKTGLTSPLSIMCVYTGATQRLTNTKGLQYRRFAGVDSLQRALDWRAKTRKGKEKSCPKSGNFSVHNDQSSHLIYLTPAGFRQRGSSAAPKSSPLPNIYSVVQLSIPQSLPELSQMEIFLSWLRIQQLN